MAYDSEVGEEDSKSSAVEAFLNALKGEGGFDMNGGGMFGAEIATGSGGGVTAFNRYQNGSPIKVNITAQTKEAMAYFQEAGWTRQQASGIVANLIKESGLNPGIHGDGGAAYGLAQWHPDRQAEFAKRFGHSIQEGTFKEQLQFVNYELTEGKEMAAGAALRNATTAGEAGAIISSRYERPLNVASEMDERARMAMNIDSAAAKNFNFTPPNITAAFNPVAASNLIEANAAPGPTGWCAQHVREALQAGGIDMSGNPGNAAGYNAFLPKRGFERVVGNAKDVAAYSPQVGDVAVFTGPAHPDGHIGMYTKEGSWVSDFDHSAMADQFSGLKNKQYDFAIYRHETQMAPAIAANQTPAQLPNAAAGQNYDALKQQAADAVTAKPALAAANDDAPKPTAAKTDEEKLKTAADMKPANKASGGNTGQVLANADMKPKMALPGV